MDGVDPLSRHLGEVFFRFSWVYETLWVERGSVDITPPSSQSVYT